MSAHVLLNLSNESGKRDKMRGFCECLFILTACDQNRVVLTHDGHVYVL